LLNLHTKAQSKKNTLFLKQYLEENINHKSWKIKIESKNKISIYYKEKITFTNHYPIIGYDWEKKSSFIEKFSSKKYQTSYSIKISRRMKAFSISKFENEENRRHSKILKDNPKAILGTRKLIKKGKFYFILWDSLLDNSLISGYRCTENKKFKKELKSLSETISSYFEKHKQLNQWKTQADSLNIPSEIKKK
jgi:hypothetical protein